MLCYIFLHFAFSTLVFFYTSVLNFYSITLLYYHHLHYYSCTLVNLYISKLLHLLHLYICKAQFYKFKYFCIFSIDLEFKGGWGIGRDLIEIPGISEQCTICLDLYSTGSIPDFLPSLQWSLFYRINPWLPAFSSMIFILQDKPLTSCLLFNDLYSPG